MTPEPVAARPPAAPTAAPGAAHPPRRTPARHALAALAVAALGAVLAAPLAGCGVRLETPAPVAPSPDAAELLRDRSAAQAADLAELARGAAPGADDASAAVLTRVATDSDTHTAAFGGVYVAFPGATPSPTSPPTEEPAPPSAAAVLAALRAAEQDARTDAATVPEAPMARLLAAVAIDRALLVDALAAVVEGAAPELGEVTVPTELPTGMDAQTAAVLVESEDALGMAWEVAAARADGDARERDAERAALHRARAEAWAAAADLDGTGTDPRRSAYDLPDALTSADAAPDVVGTALGELEARLGADYADLAVTLAPDARLPVLEAAVEAYRRAAGLGASIGPLPGAEPDQAG